MALYESKIQSLPRLGKGKVRDIYAVGGDKMLIVTSDRLSAFDVVLADPIPDKGRVLNEMANFWFARLGHIVPNQLTGIDPESVVSEDEKSEVRGRSVVVKKLKPLPIEAVVRGYIIGSGWKDYQKTGKVCGIELPQGLQQAQKLPQPIFTPATKAETGHDENISFERGREADRQGRWPRRCATSASASTRRRADYAATKGIIIADTKFEFGLDDKGNVRADRRGPDRRFVALLAGRLLQGRACRRLRTTSSSCATTWKRSTGTRRRRRRSCPAKSSRRTSEKYREALQRLTGKTLRSA